MLFQWLYFVAQLATRAGSRHHLRFESYTSTTCSQTATNSPIVPAAATWSYTASDAGFGCTAGRSSTFGTPKVVGRFGGGSVSAGAAPAHRPPASVEMVAENGQNAVRRWDHSEMITVQ